MRITSHAHIFYGSKAMCLENLVRCITGSSSDGLGINRTGYHFQSPKNWINDPNGPMYYNGIYHLFYQYNPNSAEWGDIVWAHSVSKDMVNWFHVDIALHPTDPFDIKGCWSGSTTILPGKGPVIFYTGGDTENRQVQNIAVPKDLSDPLLVEWKKLDQNPVISTPDGIKPDKFRDPSTGWLGEDGYWRVIIGSEKSRLGMALLFKSKDFLTWTQSENTFHSASTASAENGMWECVDFFPVALKGEAALDTSARGDNIKYVFKVSDQDTFSDFYTVGDYLLNNGEYYTPDNTVGDPYSPVTALRLDYGKFYASKTFLDEAKNRRILWAWVNEPDSNADAIERRWAGIQSIPRTLWLDKNEKQLLQWPVEELATLRTDEVGCTNEPLTTGRPLFEVQGITAAQADIEVTFRIPSLENAEVFDPSWVDAQQLCGEKGAAVQGGIGPFGLLTLASKELEEYTAVFFRVFKAQDKYVVLMGSGGGRSSLRGEGLSKPSYGAFVDVDLVDGEISLRCLIDHSVVESFGAGGKACITTRTYPTLAVGKEAHLFAFNYGSETVEIAKLNAWTMKTPEMNLSDGVTLLRAA
ncbi:beta-fructofuranosidase, insoluble isoenzyme 1-like isoform X1 [Papaver somniferum]|nr:beta-fructofuranosidase, insoluble isoenzyme 1-like isoform X1 [Papaver somniferum]